MEEMILFNKNKTKQQTNGERTADDKQENKTRSSSFGLLEQTIMFWLTS